MRAMRPPKREILLDPGIFSTAMKLFIRYDHPTRVLSAAQTRLWARRALRSVKGASFEGKCELSILFTGDGAVRNMNRRYRKKDKTTDVLAFPLREGKALRDGLPGSAALGDVVISVPQTIRQAKAAGKKPAQEAALLLVHGILHLLGFDHATAAQEKRMFGLQAEILKKV